MWRAWKGERQHPESPKKLIAMLHREAVGRWLLGQLFILINSLLLKERCEKSAELLTRDVALLFFTIPHFVPLPAQAKSASSNYSLMFSKHHGHTLKGEGRFK